MKRGRTVHMFLSARARMAALAALALAAAPAHGATTLSSVIDDAGAIAARTGQWIQSQALGVWGGDMDAILNTAFVLAGLIALLGVWLLARPTRTRPAESVIALPDGQGVVATANAVPVAPEAEEAMPSMRLLEAVAAAKAQFAISEAERARRG